MQKRIAKVGMEDLYDLVCSKLENLNAKKQDAITLAVQKVEMEFAEQEDLLKNMIDETSDVVEEPDECNSEEEIIDAETSNNDIVEY